MPGELRDLLGELRKEGAAAVAEDLKVFLEKGKEDLVPEAKHIAEGMLRLGKALAGGKNKSIQVTWGSLQRQLGDLQAICYRRGYQAGIQLVGRIASVVLGILLKRLGV